MSDCALSYRFGGGRTRPVFRPARGRFVARQCSVRFDLVHAVAGSERSDGPKAPGSGTSLRSDPACGRVPEPQVAVPSHRGEQFAAGAEGDGEDVALVRGERFADTLPRCGIPETDGAIAARGGQHPAIGAVDDRDDATAPLFALGISLAFSGIRRWVGEFEGFHANRIPERTYCVCRPRGFGSSKRP